MLAIAWRVWGVMPPGTMVPVRGSSPIQPAVRIVLEVGEFDETLGQRGWIEQSLLGRG